MGGLDTGGGVEKSRTGIEGFDLIAYGGLPRGRTTLLSGTAGSAKTVFAVQFLAAGIDSGGRAGRVRHVRGVARRHPPQHRRLRLGHRRLGGGAGSGRSSTHRPSRASPGGHR